MGVERRLTVCIPTYNRSGYLREAIESVQAAAAGLSIDQVEILVSDNASTDDTAGVIKELQSKSGFKLVYRRNEKNLGFDGNVLAMVAAAEGEYCWLLGDDDKIAPGALKLILAEIDLRENIDLFFGDKEDFNEDFSQEFKKRPIFKGTEQQIFDFSKNGLKEYFAYSDKLINFFNFISCLVVKRSKWLAVPDPQRFVGSGYIHLYMVMSMLWKNGGGRLKTLPEPIVYRRWGTDRIAGIIKRLRGDIEAYDAISREVLTDRRYVRRLNRLLLKNDVYSWAVRARIEEGRRFYTEALPLLFDHFWSYPLFWSKIVPLLIIPASILRLLRWSYRRSVKGEPVGVNDI